jgi:hypothetical protein
MHENALRWIRFLRQYGPIPRNDNMYDESIRRAARRAKTAPIHFEHPYQSEILSLFAANKPPTSIVLTGTAGDGKTHLCRLVWSQLGGTDITWNTAESYISMSVTELNLTLHVIRDLSSWVPLRHTAWDAEKADLLHLFCKTLFDPNPKDCFLIAANDGQLIETWRRLPKAAFVNETSAVFETLLVEDRQHHEDVNLHFFNLSRGSSAELFDRALQSFLAHEGWQACFADSDNPNDAFGANCPIRRNYELLSSPLLQKRLRALFELCDYSNLHIPIRQILLLLSNTILGHPDVKDGLMVPGDVRKIIQAGTSSKASIYNNIFGWNLPESRRAALTVFDYLDRFRIGHETANRIDNVLIFGEADPNLKSYFDALLAADTFYGADERYRAAQREYVEGADENEERSAAFLQQLAGQRRRLFFVIPEQQEDELHLWELTVFKFAGEYLTRVVPVLASASRVDRPIVARLVKGLNRVFVGMLLASDQKLILATSLSYASAKISRMFEEEISVAPRRGEKVEIVLDNKIPTLRVHLSSTIYSDLPLHLTRYEFLSRVAEGALPNSFSKECYEDILAFKTHLLSKLSQRRSEDNEPLDARVFRLLNIDEADMPSVITVELSDA